MDSHSKSEQHRVTCEQLDRFSSLNSGDQTFTFWGIELVVQAIKWSRPDPTSAIDLAGHDLVWSGQVTRKSKYAWDKETRKKSSNSLAILAAVQN